MMKMMMMMTMMMTMMMMMMTAFPALKTIFSEVAKAVRLNPSIGEKDVYDYPFEGICRKPLFSFFREICLQF